MIACKYRRISLAPWELGENKRAATHVDPCSSSPACNLSLVLETGCEAVMRYRRRYVRTADKPNSHGCSSTPPSPLYVSKSSRTGPRNVEEHGFGLVTTPAEREEKWGQFIGAARQGHKRTRVRPKNATIPRPFKEPKKYPRARTPFRRGIQHQALVSTSVHQSQSHRQGARYDATARWAGRGRRR